MSLCNCHTKEEDYQVTLNTLYCVAMPATASSDSSRSIQHEVDRSLSVTLDWLAIKLLLFSLIRQILYLKTIINNPICCCCYSLLCKLMQTAEDDFSRATKTREIRVLEKGGQKLVDILPRTDPEQSNRFCRIQEDQMSN